MRGRIRRAPAPAELHPRLLAGDAEAAERAAREAMDDGLTTAAIDVELIAPALFMVGEKWALGEITVADEHLASEIALRVLALSAWRAAPSVSVSVAASCCSRPRASATRSA